MTHSTANLVLGQHRQRLVRFAVLGCSNAVIGYAVFHLLMNAQLLPDQTRVALSQACSYGVGLAWAFVWSRQWAFRGAGEVGLAVQTTRFLFVQGLGLLLSIVLVSAAIDGLGWRPLPGWLAAMSVVTAANYLAMASWVFPAAPLSHRPQEDKVP